MINNNETLIKIRRSWDDINVGESYLINLNHLSWDTFSGGLRKRSPRPFIHGYIWCDKIVGKVGHSHKHGKHKYHWIKVCVLKKDNPQSYDKILQIANAKSFVKRNY